MQEVIKRMGKMKGMKGPSSLALTLLPRMLGDMSAEAKDEELRQAATFLMLGLAWVLEGETASEFQINMLKREVTCTQGAGSLPRLVGRMETGPAE